MTKKNKVPFPYLQKARKIKGLTQLDVAKKTGIKYHTFVSQIETGECSLPPHRMESWARVLGVPLDEFNTDQTLTVKLVFKGTNIEFVDFSAEVDYGRKT